MMMLQKSLGIKQVILVENVILVTNGPGTESDKPTSGLDNKFDNFDYTKEESEAGYKNFCVIRCKVKSIEWLYLAAKGHRRALFDLENNKKNWLVP